MVPGQFRARADDDRFGPAAHFDGVVGDEAIAALRARGVNYVTINCGLAYPGCDELVDRARASPSLRLLGYRSVETEPDMVLTLRPEWKSWDDYLASMTSSYRSAAKKLLKDCDAAGVTLREATADAPRARGLVFHPPV